MTQVAAQFDRPDEPSPGAPGARSLMRRVMSDAMRRWAARVGLVWIAVMVFAAVFAPLLANSHPLLMKTEAGWSSPLLANLTPVDVLLLAAFVVIVVLLLLHRVSVQRRVAAGLTVLAMVTPLCFWLVEPPMVTVYEKYRQMGAAGEIASAVYAPLPYSPSDRLRDQPNLRLSAPTLAHPLGVTVNGADLLSNMIYGTRIALSIGFISTGIAVAIGIVIGGLMGYFSGIFDLLGMRLVEIFSAIPTLFLLLAFVAAFGANLYMMMVIIGLTSWVGYAVFIRAEFLKLRQQDFVVAAKACGIPLWSILFRHMLPNGVAPVLVTASFGVAGAILAESTLSFLGIGLTEEASWGKLLNQALGVGGTFSWWIALYPGLAIFLTVFAYNLVGESLRDAIDPHTQRAVA